VIKVKSFEREEITMKGLLTMLLVFLCVFIMFKDAYSNLDTGLVAFIHSMEMPMMKAGMEIMGQLMVQS